MGVAVSIVCNAFNHEKYIRKALEGFVMQKTTFPFEILVHDDASTDGTAAIIREFEEKYPEIMKPIYETENLYSKKDGSLPRLQYGRVQGKYIAVCEGDDYWTDPLKLQKQYDALEAHPEIDMCACGTLTEKNGVIVGQVTPADADTVIPVEKVIMGGGGFLPTPSIMYRAQLLEDPPPFLKELWLDYTVQIRGAMRGGVLYLAEPMAVYRLYTEGSWTRQFASNPQNMRPHMDRIAAMLRTLDADTNGRLHDTIERRVLRNEFATLCTEKNYRALTDPQFAAILRSRPFKIRMRILLGARCPALLHVLERFKNK